MVEHETSYLRVVSSNLASGQSFSIKIKTLIQRLLERSPSSNVNYGLKILDLYISRPYDQLIIIFII